MPKKKNPWVAAILSLIFGPLARIIHEQHSTTTLRSGFSLFMNKSG